MKYDALQDEIKRQVIAAMANDGIFPANNDEIIFNEKIRFNTLEDKEKGSQDEGFCEIHFDGGAICGAYGNHRRGKNAIKWSFDPSQLAQGSQASQEFDDYKNENQIISLDSKKKIKWDFNPDNVKKAEAKKEQKEKSFETWLKKYDKASPKLENHPYILAKKIKLPEGSFAKVTTNGVLLVPYFDIKTGKATAIQRIFKDKKLFAPGSKLKGACACIPVNGGHLKSSEKIFICEGLATGASAATLISEPSFICVAGDCGNLESVSEALQDIKAKKIIISDDDWKTETGKNAGLEHALKVWDLGLVDGVIIPHVRGMYDKESKKPLSDFNDNINFYQTINLKIEDDLKKDIKACLTEPEKTKENLKSLLNLEKQPQPEPEPKKEPEIKTETETSTISISDKLDKLFAESEVDTSIEVPEPHYIGGLACRGYVTVLAGAPGVGKTLFLEKWVADLSQGGYILPQVDENGILHGYLGYEPTPLKTIILAGEFGRNGLIKRAQKLNLKINKNFVHAIDYLDFEREGIALLLHTKEGEENIELLAKTKKPDVLIIDSFATFFDGDENKNPEVLQSFKFLARIARENNIAVIVVHHNRKRLSSEQAKPLTLDDIIGGNAIARLSERVIAIEYNALQTANRVSLLKSWGERFTSFLYKIEKNRVSFDYAPKEPEPAKKQNVANWQAPILLYLKGKGGKGATVKEIATALEKPENTIQKQIGRLKDDEQIVQTKRGVYAIPPDSLPKIETEQLMIDDDDNFLDSKLVNDGIDWVYKAENYNPDKTEI